MTKIPPQDQLRKATMSDLLKEDGNFRPGRIIYHRFTSSKYPHQAVLERPEHVPFYRTALYDNRVFVEKVWTKVKRDTYATTLKKMQTNQVGRSNDTTDHEGKRINLVFEDWKEDDTLYTFTSRGKTYLVYKKEMPVTVVEVKTLFQEQN